MDLDPDKVTNNMDEAALQAELLKAFRGEMGQPNAPAGGPPPPPGVNPTDPTGAGGGMMGTGQAPVPGEQGFSGNTGGQGGQAGTQPPQAIN